MILQVMWSTSLTYYFQKAATETTKIWLLTANTRLQTLMFGKRTKGMQITFQEDTEEVKVLRKHISSLVRTWAQPSASTSFPQDLKTGDLQDRNMGSSQNTWPRIAPRTGKDCKSKKKPGNNSPGLTMILCPADSRSPTDAGELNWEEQNP